MKAETGVQWLLRVIAITTIPCFFYAIGPQSWLNSLFNWVDPGLTPGLFVSYITRCLLGAYAFLGVQAVIWSTDVRRYRPLILNLCFFFMIAAIGGLIAQFSTVSSAERTKVFWIIFVDLAEGLAHLILLAILTLRVPGGHTNVITGTPAARPD